MIVWRDRENRACVAFDRLGTFHWDLGYIFERDHLHDDSLLCLSGIEDISKPEIASRDLHLSRLWRPSQRAAAQPGKSGMQGVRAPRDNDGADQACDRVQL
jgi:hypothetical protein